MAANKPSEYGDYDIDTPQDVYEQQNAQYDKEQQSPNATLRAMSNIRQGVQGAFGGGPQMDNAKAIQNRMRSILSDARSQEQPDEDPLTSQLRIAKAVSTGMIDVAPQVAMQANTQLVKLKQAQTQQGLLQAETAGREQQTKDSAQTADLQKKLGTVVFAKQGAKDANGLPTGLVAAGTLDPNDPDYNEKAHALVTAAQQNGETLIPMSGKDFFNSKDSSAAIRGQYLLQKAQMDAQARQAEIVAKAQSGGLDSRSTFIAMRVNNAVSEGVAALKNITELPIGSNVGVWGVGDKPGESLIHATIDTLRNQMSSEDVRRYNVMVTGLANNLAVTENAGMMPRGTLISGMDRVVFRAGDDPKGQTGIVALTKLAEARQVLERGSQSLLASPRYPQALKDELATDLATLTQAIPFTMHDVTELSKRNRKGDKTTIDDIINERIKSQTKDNTPQTPSGQTYTDADIATDALKYNKSQDEIRALYKQKGFTPVAATPAGGASQ